MSGNDSKSHDNASGSTSQRQTHNLALDSRAQKNIDHAWTRFLGMEASAKELPVRDVIANSWERCLSRGVNPEQKAAPLLASEDSLYAQRLRNKDLLDCAQPVLQQASHFLRDLDTLLFLTDYQGLNLHIVGDPRTMDDAHHIGLVEGSGWNEETSGSNAVGTAMATRRPTQVHGEEHYCQGFKPWTCTAAVIADPYDNQMMGVIDLSGLCSIYDKFHAPLVVAWASQIQSALAKRTAQQWQTISEYSSSQFAQFRNTGKLLLDRQGRLVNFSNNASDILRTLDIDFDPHNQQQLSNQRLSMERFGGDELIFPHDSGHWISGNWVEPVLHKGEVLGFQILLPSGANKTKTNKKAQTPSQSRLTESQLTTSQNNDYTDPFHRIYGESASLQQSTEKARKAATTPLPVLIIGETGVGKEVFANAIHESSHYSRGPFVALNCGAFSKDILNSELFGHVEGAFTGAKKGGLTGKIAAADGGTLFLDEIGEMPLDIQPIFLRVLQEKQFYPVGGVKPIDVDFRLIAATNCDLRSAVNTGKFRKDLFFRLSAVTIGLDPLSGRKEDIQGIAKLVMTRISKTREIMPKRFSPALMSALKNREWPGNIRELVNVVECMCFMSERETLTLDDLPEGYRVSDDPILNTPLSQPEGFQADRKPLSRAAGEGNTGKLTMAEKQAIETALRQCEGNMTQTAKKLGIAKSTLYQKLKKYNIKSQLFKPTD